MSVTINDMVSANKKVFFQFYKHKELWYVTETGFEFPVPIEDCGDATFLSEDRAMLFMRYIRKHLDATEAAKAEIVSAVESGTVSACACMGPVGNDPHCPCRMRSLGLTPTNTWTPEVVERLEAALSSMSRTA